MFLFAPSEEKRKQREERDAKFYEPTPEVEPFPQLHKQGVVTIRHDADTLYRCSDSRGPLNDGAVNIAYVTTHDPKRHSADKHLLLLHPACANQAAWYPTTADIIHSAGLTLTTIDLRGHGRSDTPDGPYTIPLYAADVAAALKSIHGDDVRVHAAGISLGWGTCFSLAFNYPQLILTLSGSGYLTNQVNAKGRWLKKMIASESMNRSQGLEALGKQAGPRMVKLLKQMTMTSYVQTMAAGLLYNESAKLATLNAPLLWMWPVGDGGFGPFMPLAALRKEMAMAPLELPKEIKVFNDTGKEGHGFYAQDPEKFFGAVVEWVGKHPKGCTDGPFPPPPPKKTASFSRGAMMAAIAVAVVVVAWKYAQLP